MTEKRARLGEQIDDYCPRCKLLLTHAVQALAGDQVRTVVCNTCMHTHSYRHGKGGRKKDSKQSLFEQILAKRPPTQVAGMPTTKKHPGRDEDE